MERFVFYLRPVDAAEIEKQRQACHRLAGDNAVIIAEFVDVGWESRQEFLRAIDLSAQKGATLVTAPCGDRISNL